MKFVVDQPLIGLAKWLRLCGFDAMVGGFAAAPVSLPPPAPETFFLTRQAGLSRLPREDILVLSASDPLDQLTEVCRRLKITRRDLAPLSRCGECNDLLIPVPRDSALGLVPDHVFHTQAEFFQCPRCRRLYWPGSHPARITARVEEALKGKGSRSSSRTSTRKGASHGV